MRALSVTSQTDLYCTAPYICTVTIPLLQKKLHKGVREAKFSLAFQNALHSKSDVLTGHKTQNRRIPLVLQASFSQMISNFVKEINFRNKKNTGFGSV